MARKKSDRRSTEETRARAPASASASDAAGVRVTPEQVLDVLAREPGPVGWKELVALTESFDPARRKALRQVVRALESDGRMTEDGQGCFRPAAASEDTGLLESSGRQLTFAGVPVARVRGFRGRPGDRVQADVQGDSATVIRVLEYSAQPVVGELKWQGRTPYVESLSPEYRGKVILQEKPRHGQDGDTVSVRIVGEEQDGLVGVVTGVVSNSDAVAHAAETLLESHGVPREWADGVEAAAAKLPTQVQPGRYRDRRSLMDLPLVTIDGETAKDFDDAVFAEPSGDGWRLIVAIADVAHYVKLDSVLDRSAWERGNSTYLPDRVIPMLPESLSNGLCSLVPDEPRLALACDIRLSRRGEITGFEFYDSIICSWQRLTYTRVQEFLDAGALDVEAEVQASLRHLKSVYEALRVAREARGALDFDTHEATPEIVDGRIVAIHPVTRNDAHRLIEEAMITANVCAGTFLEEQGRGGLYRIHEPPDGEKSEALRQALAYAGIRLSKEEMNPRTVHAALDQLGDRPDRWIFELLTLRSMNQAVYSPVNKGHFGLALDRYMHFTSPIRRYADLVVHRAIKSALRGETSDMSPDWLVATGEHISMTERRSDAVAWGVDSWLKCDYIADRVGEVFDGVVMGVTDFGLFVELTGFYIQGLVHISALGQDYYRFVPNSMALVGENSGMRYGLGDPLQVQLVEVQASVGKVDLALVGKGGDGPSGSSSGRSGKGGKSGRGGSGRGAKGKRSGRRR